MRITALFPLAFLATAAMAEGTKDFYTYDQGGAPQQAVAAETRDPVQLFVEANIAETLYHELAHALIDIVDIPIFGPEEFAADAFAIVMVNRLHDEAKVLQIAGDVATNYWRYAEETGRHRDDLALWGVHAPDLQRYYTFTCLMYGANPHGREELVEIFDLPEARVETCEEEYEMTERAWGNVLERLATDAPGQSIRLDWVLNEEDHLTKFVANEVARLNAEMVLPDTLNVSVIPCGESNAFYDPDLLEIQICTELAEELAEFAP